MLDDSYILNLHFKDSDDLGGCAPEDDQLCHLYRWESLFWTHQQKEKLREFCFFIAQFKTKTLTV